VEFTAKNQFLQLVEYLVGNPFGADGFEPFFHSLSGFRKKFDGMTHGDLCTGLGQHVGNLDHAGRTTRGQYVGAGVAWICVAFFRPMLLEMS
jgi:hypothetical protein